VNLFYQPELSNGVTRLDREESRHCVKVLRKRNGDPINITDGQGFFYTALITDASPSECEFKIIKKEPERLAPHKIHIAVSPTKNVDRIEWFVEKAVEFGIHEITLLECEHTERAFIKTDRLLKVAVSAMKQSLKATLPTINALKPVTELVKLSGVYNRYIAFVDSGNPLHLKDVVMNEKESLVLIGPEGDFSKHELDLAIENNFIKVSLGKSRLRTETAALAACFILNIRNEL
jgi:16S rRNA (uracil1498-N3)-methyltransferase